ncbi:MAG: hypothetical protein WCV67_05975 [Victivallaceae bacterium]
MHSINEHSTKVFKHLLVLMPEGHLKLDNTAGTFMPVIVEQLSAHSGFEAVYSVSHYGEQNGDLMADPDMTFGLKEGNFYPLSFRNDYVGVDQYVISDQEGAESKVNLKLQHELTEFANMWFKNIAGQQGLKL